VTPGYGEGVYIGSAVSVTGFDYRCDRNKVLNCTFRGIAAEHIDVKEFTTGTEIGGCTFFGDGMTGENYAGSFIDIAYGSNTWSCDPGEGPESRLEHTISFSFTYSDAENSEDSVLVYYILRPWGMRWDDVREADTGDMLYEDMMPQHYEDWYLPQLG
jgi:hypothetical protein